MWRPFLLFLLLPVAISPGLAQSVAPPAQQAPQASQPAAPAEAPGPWHLTPIVRLGDPLPGVGGRLEEVGDAYVLDSGWVVFWARYGPKEWAAFSAKDNSVKLIFVEGKEVRPPNSDAQEPLRIERKSLWRGGTSFVPAGNRLYITVVFGAMRHSSVYSWDGERLRRVLTRTDTVDIAGVPHTIRTAYVVEANRGWALLTYETEKPQRYWGKALYDGEKLMPLVREGEELPGMPGVALKVGSKYRPFKTFAVVPGAALAVMDVKGAPYERALFRLSPGKAEKLLAAGDPDPSGSGTLAGEISIGGMSSTDIFAVRFLGVSWVPSQSFMLPDSPSYGLLMTLIRQQGKFLRPLDAETLKAQFDEYRSHSALSPKFPLVAGADLGSGEFSYAIWAAGFLKPDSPHYAYLVTSSRSQKLPDSKVRELSYTDLWLFDGERVRNLTPTFRMDSSSEIHPIGGTSPGLILHAVWKGDGIEGVKSVREESWWFLSAEQPDHLEPLPDLVTDQRVHLTPDHVLVWRARNEGVVALEDGLYVASKP